MTRWRHRIIIRPAARFLVAGLAAGAICLLAVPGPTAGARAPGCGDRPGKNLRGNALVRVYSVKDQEGLRQVYGCLKRTGRTRPLGPRAALVGRPIVLTGVWAAAAEQRGKGQDDFLRDVIARNFESGARNLCRIGGADRPEQLIPVSALVVTGKGDIGWSGREKLYMAQPVVGACVDDSNEILARGSGLELNSLGLSRETLTWSNEGHEESFQFN